MNSSSLSLSASRSSLACRHTWRALHCLRCIVCIVCIVCAALLALLTSCCDELPQPSRAQPSDAAERCKTEELQSLRQQASSDRLAPAILHAHRHVATVQAAANGGAAVDACGRVHHVLALLSGDQVHDLHSRVKLSCGRRVEPVPKTRGGQSARECPQSESSPKQLCFASVRRGLHVCGSPLQHLRRVRCTRQRCARVSEAVHEVRRHHCSSCSLRSSAVYVTILLA